MPIPVEHNSSITTKTLQQSTTAFKLILPSHQTPPAVSPKHLPLSTSLHRNSNAANPLVGALFGLIPTQLNIPTHTPHNFPSTNGPLQPRVRNLPRSAHRHILHPLSQLQHLPQRMFRGLGPATRRVRATPATLAARSLLFARTCDATRAQGDVLGRCRGGGDARVGEGYESDGAELDMVVPRPVNNPMHTGNTRPLRLEWLILDTMKLHYLRARFPDILVEPRHSLVERLLLGELDPGL